MPADTNGGGSSTSSQSNPYALPLEPSFLNMEPQDEFVKEIADWVAYISGGRPDIEVEAKFGVMVDRSNNQRVASRLGVLVETILNPREVSNMKFESTLSARQHEHLNKMLNERVAQTAAPSFQHAPLSARHLQTLDEFFSIPNTQDPEGKLRVSRDAKTGQLIECLIKRRLGDLHVLCPKREVDWRISVNTEEKVDISMVTDGMRPLYSRRKDRMQYGHQHFHIDLTQVMDQGNTVTHELELEFAYPEEMRRVLELRGREGPEAWGYDQLVAVFVNNCRLLSRNVIKM
ncbi:SubName: Full=Related to CTL1-RNA 5`-triphosphatase with manganese-or cobalt-dependent NTPase activities {ECO:0000313/EMBL:CCA75404.1} [Serendipita indica DSM 11827]|uniref:mRNA-capping enzyme subunit beta n=1 Tax=Serendipita indica (strain DSM 11827) TaxID=1109443 RepID=G4TVR1_SERID|nr:SubName: Full=Related to CTL1-RNA 5`-triphosphatase with manganese-or cobalt-dependent NTPase activities {ECO:0000313/EMBL:CCA75404.1} [Serendipita indica DSM 11827]CCA75404.1 related to CTL1-RNA 5`-triphosphatase with manganese-or cobalt-dependent NTPase activities [Serendipita indica DSM 11827]